MKIKFLSGATITVVCRVASCCANARPLLEIRYSGAVSPPVRLTCRAPRLHGAVPPRSGQGSAVKKKTKIRGRQSQWARRALLITIYFKEYYTHLLVPERNREPTIPDRATRERERERERECTATGRYLQSPVFAPKLPTSRWQERPRRVGMSKRRPSPWRSSKSVGLGESRCIRQLAEKSSGVGWACWGRINSNEESNVRSRLRSKGI